MTTPPFQCQDCGAPLSDEHVVYMGTQCFDCYMINPDAGTRLEPTE